MRKEQLFLVIVLIPAVLILILVGNKFSSKKIINPFAVPTPFPTISANPTSSEQTTAIDPSSSLNIEVLSPRGGDNIKSGLAVKGNARVFENVVSIRLSDSEGNILVQTTANANAPDTGQFGPFEKMLNFQTNSDTGTLEIYQVSAKDGSEIDKVTIPLLFK